MARRFKFLRKKRGDRFSGSARLATMGEAFLFAACTLFGAAMLALILTWAIVPQWRLNQDFLQTSCRVTAEPEVISRREAEETLYRPKIAIRFQVGGVDYQSGDAYDLETWFSDQASAEEAAEVFESGGTYPCWYDAQDPATAVLVRRQRIILWVLLSFPIAFLVIGTAGLGYTLWQSSISRERRAAIVKFASSTSKELFDEQPQQGSEFPAVPHDTELKNSPGTTLAYRLPIAALPGWRLFGVAIATLCWNVLVGLLLIVAVGKHLRGHPDWMLDLLVLPFIASGIWLINRAIRLFVRSNAIGATRIEISDHPLKPGQRYDVFVSQSGNLEVKTLELLLVCEEQAIYRQGTDTVTDVQAVSAQQVCTQHDFQVRPGQPYEARCSFDMPDNIMHSFRANHNSVHWKFVVHGEPKRRSDYVRDFPLIVVPGSNDASESVPDTAEQAVGN